MPTGTCKYPEHHTGPSAGPPISLLVLIALGAVVIAYWRTVVIALVVTHRFGSPDIRSLEGGACAWPDEGRQWALRD